VLGVDGCRGGWVGVVLEDGEAPVAIFAASIGALAVAAGPVAAIGIDIPIHLNEETDRPCDAAARKLIAPCGSRVFNAPVRDVLSATTYDEALRISRARCGKGISKQTWHLVPKIAEVEAWFGSAPYPVYEVFPEAAFGAMNGRVVVESKRSREGEVIRRHALIEHGIRPPARVTGAGRDDLLDACAVAWSTRRLARGEGVSIGENGNAQAIWY
jgi:predicted RNase H-like nuclease